MSGIIKGFVSEATGGILGNGKAPNADPGYNTQSEDYYATPETWSPTDSMKASAAALSSETADSVPDKTSNPWDLSNLDSSKGTLGSNLMSLRNGGLANKVGEYAINGISDSLSKYFTQQ